MYQHAIKAPDEMEELHNQFYSYIKKMEIMNMTNEEYKQLSIKEFAKKQLEDMRGNHAGLYEMCKKDYPDILEELEKEPFIDLLDAGCGPAPMISLLSENIQIDII